MVTSMKIGIGWTTLLLALPCAAQEQAPPRPVAAPPALETPAPKPVPPKAVLPQPKKPGAPTVVPGVKLQNVDKIGRTYAEGSPFNVSGGDRVQRSQLFTAAGLVSRAVLDALHLPAGWEHPIVLQIRDEPLAGGTEQRPPVWTRISQVESGFRIEINVVPRRQSVPGPLLKENLVRAVLADRVLRGKKGLDLTGAPLPPPDWLLHGTLALMEYRELGRMSQTFSSIFQLGRVLSVDDILNADPAGMDSVGMDIYRVSCGALVMMLVEQPKGGEQLAALLPSLALGGTDHGVLIGQAYPSLSGSANSLSKWWSLQIAALSQPGLEEIQLPSETGRLLAEAVVLHYTPPAPEEKRPNALKRLFTREKTAAAPSGTAVATVAAAAASESCPITDYARVLALRESAPVFQKAELALTRLMLRAHPVYRPLIQEYQEVLRDLAKKKAGKSLPATLARLESTREKLASNMQKIEDHLDWYEATQSTAPSGDFEGYLKTAASLDKPPPPRNDAISRYLDGVELELKQ